MAAPRRRQPRRDRGEGTEVPAELQRLRGHAPVRDAPFDQLQGTVRAAVDDEDGFHAAGQPRGKSFQLFEQARQIRLVPVDGDYEGEHTPRGKLLRRAHRGGSGMPCNRRNSE